MVKENAPNIPVDDKYPARVSGEGRARQESLDIASKSPQRGQMLKSKCQEGSSSSSMPSRVDLGRQATISNRAYYEPSAVQLAECINPCQIRALKSFYRNLNELVAFKQEHKHVNVKQGSVLGNW